MAKKVTIKDLAKAAGVSVTTVSQILNGKGARFSEKTRDRVHRLKAELNYVPDFNARNLILHSSKTIGVLVPNIGNPFFSSFTRGIQEVCREKEYMPLVFSANHEVELERYYLSRLVERSVDGLIIASSTITNETIDEILKPNGIPYLLFDQNQAHGQGDRVAVDDYQGGKLAAEHLLKLGHKKLVMYLPEQPTENVLNRLAGFKNALNTAGVAFDETNIVKTEFTKQGGYKNTVAVLAKQPTAVFCANDELAIGLYRGLTERNIVVPRQISIIGFDDIDLDEYVTPALTTIHQPIQQLGNEAAKLIFKRLSDKEGKLSQQLVKMPVNLIERASTAQVEG